MLTLECSEENIIHNIYIQRAYKALGFDQYR